MARHRRAAVGACSDIGSAVGWLERADKEKGRFKRPFFLGCRVQCAV
jgi:hypothetical protein